MSSNPHLFRYHNYNKTFIETGSFLGDGIKNAIFSGYDTIHSIELADEFYLKCKVLFKYNPSVSLYHGDSKTVLPGIISGLNRPATFWLDAHYSGGATAFKDSLSPLLSEIRLIGSHHIKTHTILIDDMREWKQEYPAIGFGMSDIMDEILKINLNYKFSLCDGATSNDILVAEANKYRPLNIIVFSKDRAMQLEFFIRTFNNYVKFTDRYNIKVLYTYSNDNYRRGYDRLISKLPANVTMVKEQSFKKDMLSLMDANNPYTVFFVDDNFFKESFDFYDRQMDIFDEDGRVACRSLRLHPHLSFCYTTNKPMRQPIFMADNRFDWTRAEWDYGYPMSTDGHIFRTEELLPICQRLDYENPNTFESVLVHERKHLGGLMICYDNSPIMNNPINKVQTVNNNLHGNIDAVYLNEQYLGGFVIDMSGLGGFKNVSCHQEIKINLIKE